VNLDALDELFGCGGIRRRRSYLDASSTVN
jgi:hypothetical protein